MTSGLEEAKSRMEAFLTDHQALLEQVRAENETVSGEDAFQEEAEGGARSEAGARKALLPARGEQAASSEEDKESRFWHVREQMEKIPLYREAHAEALTYLSRVTQTTGRFAEKMRSKGYPEKLIRFLQVEFTREGLLDDQALAGLILDGFRERRAESPRKMRLRLQERGIDPDVIDEVIDAEYGDEEALLEELMTHRCKEELERLRLCEDREEARKLIVRIVRTAVSRGFFQADVLRYLKSLDLKV